MIVETLMSGTQGEKAHIVYKEENGNHMGLCYDYYFDMSVQNLLLSSTVQLRLQCYLAQGVPGQESHLFP